ncbi:MAG: adenylate/guanylate cyclase domain-containing protein [Planctomycetota bacterium]|nr:adenylate/guanylate cyclase domain-containing protein [Planctomycetota bacterium]
MSARSSKLGRTIRGICLGLSATLIAATAYWSGVVEPAELWALDFRFRHLPTLEPRNDIIHIDIDDKSLDQIGRWPWPRSRLSQLVEVLNNCGARAVVLDIILPEPQQPRYVKEGFTDLYMADTGAVLGAGVPPKLVLDDAALAQTLARSPNLFLAMHVDVADASSHRRAGNLAENLADIVATRPAVTPSEIAAERRLDPTIAEETFPAAKTAAYERRIGDMLRNKPEQSLKDVLAGLCDQIVPGGDDYDIARRIYLRRRAMHILRRFALPAKSLTEGTFPSGRAMPPLVTFTQAMAHTGSVTIMPDTDGVVRRVPLLVATDSGVLPQLALAVAGESMADEHDGKYAISAQKGKVVITSGEARREIPVDANGYMLINWTPDSPDNPAAGHISTLIPAEVWQASENLQDNKNLYLMACEKMSVLVPHVFEGKPMRKYFADAAEISIKIQLARQARQSALLFRPADVPEIPPALMKQQADLDKTIERGCRKMLEFIDEVLAGADQAGGRPDETEKQVRSLRKLIRQIEQEKLQLHRQLERATRRVRKEVAGKICLVGSAATGAADFIPTPVHRRTPGVVMHANILNTILSDKFVHASSGWVSAILILLAGMLVTLVTTSRGPIESAILLLTAIIGFAFVDAGVWNGWTYWVITASPIAVMLLVFTVITVYRQLTEQRQRRQITSTFKQYLSPAMVDELVLDPTQASLGGQKRQLSCLFSDLAGFTSLSEHLGAEGTVGLLNRYLDGVGEILQVRYGGTLSKYEGDGIFAFFGAPIPQDDHATRAILSAIDCQAFLPEFNRTLRTERLLPEGAELSARIGITAGEVFVGNMGSTQRVAYTAIGDAVNLASRLETANKFFGSGILVNDDAWERARDELIGRPMGKIIVVGKTESVAVWEPLARRTDADEQLRKFADDFARGVELYAAGDFNAARECFQAIITERNDPAARLYIRLCEEGPKATDFDGIIRLTEK